MLMFVSEHRFASVKQTSRQDGLRNVLSQGASLVALGLAAGFGTSLLATRALSQLLFETSPFDPAIFASAVLLLGLLDPRVALNIE